jgi:hypothetical protein
MPARKQPVQAHEPSHRSALPQPAVTKCHSKVFLHQSPKKIVARAKSEKRSPTLEDNFRPERICTRQLIARGGQWISA